MPRQSHKKSRKGCQQCKDRKVKCDETRPKCTNCTKRSVECLFPPPGATTRSRSRVYQAQQRSLQGSREEISTTTHMSPIEDMSPAMGVAEMVLLHQYSVSTCFTISRNLALRTVWQIHIPHFGFSSPIVLRGIMALSALHLVQLKPEYQDSYLDQAELHHETALQMAAAALQKIDKENAPSIYVFSLLACIFSCAKPRKPEDFWKVIDQIIEWLNLIRGTVSILLLNEHDGFIKNGPLSPLFILGHRKSLEWEARIQPSFNAIENLGKSFATIHEMGSRNCETADIFMWLVRAPDHYLHFFHQRKPEALVIFGFFCMIIRELEWTWWMQGASSHLLQGIYYHLGEEHRCWLHWPMQQLGLVSSFP
ncbi:unnamed protein product [Penicillium salamii]|uniref:Zn(2)-C6 fungal-type domain-containing protein n=1 Tax=Penicillium salamii TaxID=1612424 RepID=A0A9W4NL88_9EURO|nr:unnamed protein product [Penicillium salamii]